MALVVSAMILGSNPVHAQASNPVTLQCQVSAQTGANGISYAIVCNGTIPDGSVVLNCQSPNAITHNNGVFNVAGSCSETITLAGATIPVTVSCTAVSINSNNGAITAASGTATVGLYDGLANATTTCSGAALSETLSPLSINNPGTCSVNASLLGIGTAQITGTGGSTVNVTNAPALILTVNSPNITASASLRGLIQASATCGASVSINLSQLFPIIIPAPCSAS